MAKLVSALVLTAAVLAPAGAAFAVTVDEVKAKGFFVFRETRIVGDFNGCDRGVKVALDKMGAFTCASFGYMYAQNPKAVLLKSNVGKQYKLLVNGVLFDGAMDY